MAFMNNRSFILGTLLAVLIFILALGGVAIYASAYNYSEKENSGSSYGSYQPANTYGMAQNTYNSQVAQPSVPPKQCKAEIGGYYNDQPYVSSSCTAPAAIIQPKQEIVTKIYIHNTGNYYPYPYRYYYPHYYPRHYYPNHQYKPFCCYKHYGWE